MAEYIVNTDTEESRYKAMGADYAAYFNNKVVKLLGNPVKEEVVRCRDCKHYDLVGITQGWWPICARGGHLMQVDIDGFCAWGERRANG